MGPVSRLFALSVSTPATKYVHKDSRLEEGDPTSFCVSLLSIAFCDARLHKAKERPGVGRYQTHEKHPHHKSMSE